MARSRLSSDIPLVLASLFISFVIWLIAKQTDQEADWVTAAVQVKNVPDNMLVETDPPRVSLNVQYPPNLGNRIVEMNFYVPIDVREVFDPQQAKWEPPTATHKETYRLRTTDVKTVNLPQSVQAIGVSPAAIEIRARLRTQAAAVKVQTTGTLAANLMLTAPPRPDPAEVLLTGSADALARVAAGNNAVLTEPVDLSALRTSGQVFPRLRLPEGVSLLARRDDRITVNLGLTERPVRQTLAAVPITLVTFNETLATRTEPASATVVMEGPASALRAIAATDIAFAPTKELAEQPGRVFEVGVEARLKNTVAAEVAQQVRIVEVRPARISVEFIPVDKQNKGPEAPAATATPAPAAP